jgi:hypothetical protein
VTPSRERRVQRPEERRSDERNTLFPVAKKDDVVGVSAAREREPIDQHERWRGVALEAGPVDATGNKFLRQRSRRLLWSLLRPYRG